MRAEAENREGRERTLRNSSGHRFMQSFLPGGLGRCFDLNVHAERRGTFLLEILLHWGWVADSVSNQLLGAPGVDSPWNSWVHVLPPGSAGLGWGSVCCESGPFTKCRLSLWLTSPNLLPPYFSNFSVGL